MARNSRFPCKSQYAESRDYHEKSIGYELITDDYQPCPVLRHDAKIRPGAFTEQFTPEQFAGILFSLMLSAVVQQNFDPSAVLEIVRRTIY